MSLARLPSVRYTLLFLSIFVAACAGSLKPVSEPVPVASPTTSVVVAPDTQHTPRARATPTTRDTSVRRDPADEAVTVLPSIIRHGGVAQPAQRVSTGTHTDEPDQPVRIALALAQPSVRLSATGNWTLFDRTGEHPLGSARSGDSYEVDARDGGVSVAGPSGSIGSLRGPLVARATDANSVLVFNGHRYRGELLVIPSGAGMIVANRVSIEQYLRGVVPLEIGVDRTALEAAAVEAQAIAARSYTYTRLDGSRPYDMVATVTDQMYGGMDVERQVADEAIEATHNMVLLYGGKVINAPYHANSGGVTAAASEVWRSGDEPYLVSVSDRIPGTDHFYCEESPKFRWTRTLDRPALLALLGKYLPQYAGAPRSGIVDVRGITETGRTSSGRVAGLMFDTDRGRFMVRGNDIRFVLRSAEGDVLPSTLFSFDAATDGDGRIVRLTLHGTGNGHGVGMDQWGAIARARAGQSYVTILQTYYPGTSIGPVI